MHKIRIYWKKNRYMPHKKFAFTRGKYYNFMEVENNGFYRLWNIKLFDMSR